MLPKILTVSVICFAAVQIIMCKPKSLKSGEEDAEAAFQALLKRSRELVADLDAHIDSVISPLIDKQLAEQQLIAVEAINKKINNVQEKISLIQENLKEIGISDECTRGYTDKIESYRINLTARTQKCTKLTSDVISTIANKTSTYGLNLLDGVMSCYVRSLHFCQYYATDDSCYDFLIDKTAKATETMATEYQLITINFDNKITSLKLPCQDLIEFEISVYPDYNLQAISQCAQNSIRNTRPDICPENS
ncbi:hypothetical protein Zmor_020220 [Zophobas morio]|uniref:Uncharacterized protein n=1 Tax=Zophobas morio TaxID=2755281 RepID=A0AA38I2G4_9CUCU|nr:hypothetical protein Zmor_020220 [Zophobas morio]